MVLELELALLVLLLLEVLLPVQGPPAQVYHQPREQRQVLEHLQRVLLGELLLLLGELQVLLPQEALQVLLQREVLQVLLLQEVLQVPVSLRRVARVSPPRGPVGLLLLEQELLQQASVHLQLEVLGPHQWGLVLPL